MKSGVNELSQQFEELVTQILWLFGGFIATYFGYRVMLRVEQSREQQAQDVLSRKRN